MSTGGSPGATVDLTKIYADDVRVFPMNPDGTPATNGQQVQGNVASGATDAGNPVKMAGVANTTNPSAATSGQRKDVWVNSFGGIVVSAVAGTGADAVANTDLASLPTQSSLALKLSTAANFVFNGTTWDRQKKPNAVSRILSAAATTNATVIKASAGEIYHVDGWNANAAARFLKFYNKATAPTVGTDTPIWTEYLAPTAKFSFSLPAGLYFSAGISMALTTGVLDADTGALTLADILALNVAYA